MSQELFRIRLDVMIDLSHPLAKRAQVMPWVEIVVAISAILLPALGMLGRRYCRSG